MYITRKSLLERLDTRAKELTELPLDGTAMSERILKTIAELYESAKVESSFQDEWFDSAYHSPITGELEFFIARVLYHFSDTHGLRWRIRLRRQVAKTAPDIRIEVEGKTIAVIEIKAKVGWMQAFFSPERYQRDLERFNADESDYDPVAANEYARGQLAKYGATFGLSNEDVYMLIPTLALVHRNHYTTDLDGYYSNFAETSGLPRENLILLSNNIRLDLSYRMGELMPSGNFERMLSELAAKTPSATQSIHSAEPEQDESEDPEEVEEQPKESVDYSNTPIRRFLLQLVERGRDRCPFTRRMKVYEKQFIGTSAGMRGGKYFYGITHDRSQVELYIDRGDKAENKRIFDLLLAKKNAIEAAFGNPLFWQRLDDKRACRISFRINRGLLEPERNWPALQDELVDRMIRLDNSLRPYMRELP